MKDFVDLPFVLLYFNNKHHKNACTQKMFFTHFFFAEYNMKFTKGVGRIRRLLLLFLLFLILPSVHAEPFQVSDVNGDQLPDLLFLDGSNVYVQLGDGLGGVGSSQPITLDHTPVKLDVADLNGDGQDDLITLDVNGVLGLSIGTGLGDFGNRTVLDIGLDVLENAADVKLGFVDDDENQDIAVLINGVTVSRVVYLLNTGSGGFHPSVDVNFLSLVGDVDLHLDDHNEDDHADFIVVDLLGNVIEILSDGLGGYNTPTIIVPGLPVGGVYFRDIDNDGFLDMLVLDELLGILSLRLGLGNGGFGNAITVNVGLLPSDLVTVDINRDGNQDVIVVNAGDNTATVLLGDGLGGLTELVGNLVEDLLGIIGGLGLPVAIVSTDFNGDCRLDLAIWDDITDSYVVTLNQSGPDLNDLIFCHVFEDLSVN